MCDHPSMLESGDRVGGYLIGRRLGAGGQGVVYLARHVKLDRLDAMKVLWPHVADNLEARRLFEREAVGAARLRHPNIAVVYDAGEAAGSMFIAMQYVDGRSLAQIIEEGGAIASDRALLLLEQLAGALDAAHEVGIVHRDVKPANVLVEKLSTGKDVAYLVDFGIAKLLETTGVAAASQVSGTVGYMAPERFAGMTGDRYTDQYSLACVAFQCLTGELPFPGPDPASMIAGHLDDLRPSLVARRPDFPAEVDAVFARALAKEPEHRFPSCSDFVRALRESLSATPITHTNVPISRGLPPTGPMSPAVTPPSDSMPRPAPRQGPSRESPPRQSTPREGPPREGPPRQGPSRKGPARQGPPREGSLRQAPSHQGRAGVRTRRRRWLIAVGLVAVLLVATSVVLFGPWRIWPPGSRTMGESSRLIRTLTGHTSGVNAVVYSPDGSQLASGSWDTTVKVWRVDNGDVVHTLTGHTDGVLAMAYSPDGALLATGGSDKDKSVRVWTKAGEPARTMTGYTGGISSVAYSPDGSQLAAASWDWTVQVRKAETGAILFILIDHKNSVRSVVYSHDGSQLVTASDDATVRVWRTDTGAMVRMMTGHTGGVNSVTYSPDGSQLATASSDMTARVWSAATGELVRTLGGHTGGVNSVAYSPDGSQLATASSDKTIRVWSAATGELLHTLTGHTGSVTAVVYSPDGSQLASASDDGTVRVWRT
jgi:WD40 repeat protein/serine/threonine protein kinase